MMNQNPARDLHEQFEAILPAVEKWARAYLRGQSAEMREEGLADVTAYAWATFYGLAERGELGRFFPSVVAKFGVRRFLVGRRFGNRHRTGDVLSPSREKPMSLQSRSTGRNTKLEDEDTEGAIDTLRETLVDRGIVPVPVQANYELDWPRWIDSLSPVNRRIVARLAQGDAPGEVAKLVGLSPARISQVRKELRESWFSFNNTIANDHQGE